MTTPDPSGADPCPPSPRRSATHVLTRRPDLADLPFVGAAVYAALLDNTTFVSAREETWKRDRS